MRYLQSTLGLLLLLGCSAFAANPPAGKYTVVFSDKATLGNGPNPISTSRVVTGVARVDPDGYIFVVLSSGELPVRGVTTPARATKVQANSTAIFIDSVDNTVYDVTFSSTGFTLVAKTETVVPFGEAPDQLVARRFVWKFTQVP